MFWKKNKQWIIVLNFLMIFGAVYLFGIRIIREHIISQKNAIRVIEATQEKDRARIAQLTKLKSDYEFAMENEQRIPNFLSKDMIIDLYREIDLIGEKTGNKVEYEVIDPPDILSAKSKNASKDASAIGNGLPTKEIIQLRVETAGTFSGLINLLKKIENTKYLMDVISIEIRATEANEKPQVRKVPGESEGAAEAQENENSEVEAVLNVVVYTQK